MMCDGTNARLFDKQKEVSHAIEYSSPGIFATMDNETGAVFDKLCIFLYNYNGSSRCVLGLMRKWITKLAVLVFMSLAQ